MQNFSEFKNHSHLSSKKEKRENKKVSLNSERVEIMALVGLVNTNLLWDCLFLVLQL